MFNPFFNPYRVRRIDQGGIPTLDTIFSNVDTTPPMPNVPAPQMK